MPDKSITLLQKKIKHFKLDAPLNDGKTSIDAPSEENEKTLTLTKTIEKDIVLYETLEDLVIEDENKKLPPLTTYFSTQDRLANQEKLSFSIDEEDIERIALETINITRYPLKVMRLLKPLDDEFEEVLVSNNIKFSKRADYLIAGYRYLLPPAPQKDSSPWHTGRVLDTFLRNKEKDFGFKRTLKVIGGVANTNQAQCVIENKASLSYNIQIGDLLLHGSQTSRLILLALMIAADKGLLSLTLKNGSTLTGPEFVELLLKRNINDTSLWNWTIGKFADDVPEANPFDVSSYSYSCRSPYTMNSLMMCFPEFLPNISDCLLNSFHKAAFEIILRIKHQYCFDQGFQDHNKCDIPNETIYFHLMHTMMHSRPTSGKHPKPYPFLLDARNEREDHRNYRTTKYEGIKKRAPKTTHPIEQYSSWNNFFDEKAKNLQAPWVYEKLALAGDAKAMTNFYTRNPASLVSKAQPLIEPVIKAFYNAIDNMPEGQNRNEVIHRYSACLYLLCKAGGVVHFNLLKLDKQNLLGLREKYEKKYEDKFDSLREFVQSKYFKLLEEADRKKYLNFLDGSTTQKNESLYDKNGPFFPHSNKIAYPNPLNEESYTLLLQFINSDYFGLLDQSEQDKYKDWSQSIYNNSHSDNNNLSCPFDYSNSSS